jgi:hypothetical protein
MFTVTKPALTLFVAGGMCAALAACSSSSSTSAPAASTTSASAPASSAPASSAPASSAPASSAPAASAIPAADCTVIKQVDSSAISTLAPLQSESTAQATAALNAYGKQLEGDLVKLTSAPGKAALGAYITALKKASTQSTADATGTITTALGTLGSACP